MAASLAVVALTTGQRNLRPLDEKGAIESRSHSRHNIRSGQPGPGGEYA
jgi:hypothetical protein